MPCSEQEEIREDTRKPPVTVFKRMDFQEFDYEVRNDEEWVEALFFKRFSGPEDKLAHFFGRQVCRSSFEQYVSHRTFRVQDADNIFLMFVLSAMQIVLG